MFVFSPYQQRTEFKKKTHSKSTKYTKIIHNNSLVSNTFYTT